MSGCLRDVVTLSCWSSNNRCLQLGAELPWVERGAILTLLGSAERAFYLIELPTGPVHASSVPA
ncbi:hypothetical protein FHP25_23790 [Vineibacter terrae]|uniref:Uncharacterized protein n=1 Tax=Vineibacter terrae TaxID=2586908 RepID=A0A5C8PG60_9HYPH|nr:hypothetical protein [Vineibacter terrae]TXL72797.1 hypothetical protein FHP25_23790 [Vineibacter terrae]